MAGYTRNDTPNNIADGNVINASDLDGEFDAIQTAFNGSSGHSHDGTTGQGPQIATAGLTDNAVTTAKITDANVTLAKMAANSVDSDQYVDGSIDKVHLAADIVDGTKIADDSIDSEHYVDGSIDAAHIGNLQVTTAKIAADAIDGTKIADDVIDSEHYTAGSIDAEHLASDSVTTAKILDANVTTAKIAADAIDGTKIADDVIDSEHYVAGSIDGEHLAADIIDGTKIADDVIDSEHYVAGSIDAEHLAANSVTSAKLDTNIQVAGTLGVTGETTLTTHLNMGDNDIIKLGDSADLQIYHDGSNSYISESGTGNLFLGATNLFLRSSSGETYLGAVQDGAVSLYHDNLAKLATTATGVDVTGVITTDGMTTSADINFGDNDKAVFGAGSDLQIYHTGTESIISDAGTGNLKIYGENLELQATSTGETYFNAIANGAVTLYYDNAAKLATSSGGVTVTGTVTSDGLVMGDDEEIQIGNSTDLRIYHDSVNGNSVIRDAGTGNLRIMADDFQVTNADASSNLIFANDATGVVTLYHNGNSKLATTSTGVDITGDLGISNDVEVTGRSVGVTITAENDGSFDLAVGNDFTCTTTADTEITFTNAAAGQSGNIKFVNGGSHVITANALVAINADVLSTLSTTGTYHLAYYVTAASGNDTILVSASAALT